MNEIVECHSGFAYADRPVALTWEGQRLEIIQIVVEWRTPQEKHFQVRTNDKRIFHIIYHEIENEWKIHEIQEA
jgi:hypothetical protein